MRGGISQCSVRYSKANNNFIGDGYDTTKPTNFLMYLDMNNLYGWAMMEPLPLTDFRWILVKTTNIDFIINTPDDSEIGYMLEVDLEYPKELHDSHSDYPFCAEHRAPPNSKTKKLLLTLYDKKKYVLHYRTLKYALSQGLKLNKVHRVLQFTQTAWLKPYIELNTLERTNAKNDFEKNLFKLFSNAIFGKSMENVRDRADIKLKNKWDGKDGVRVLIARPNFKSRTIFNENLVAIEMKKSEVFLNKPIIIGATVLEISKLKMYSFHYDYIKKEFKNNCRILYTDTDSFVYDIKTENFYDFMKRRSELFDTSDYASDNCHKIELKHKKVPGLMKDEVCGKCMTEFVGIRSKMYSIRINGIDKVKKAKGVKKNVINKKIHFLDYYNCMKDHCIITEKQNTILSKLHNVFSIERSKIVLNPFDDKRFILENKIDTLPWGHYSILEK